MGICHIVCAAPNQPVLSLELAPGDLLIAADGGYAACRSAGLSPQVLVGDFDSLEGGRPAGFEGTCLELPCAKDDTDTLAALKLGLEDGFREFVLHNALGGDFGHSLANVKALAWLENRGAHGVLLGATQRVELVFPHQKRHFLNVKPGTRVSVFAFGGDAQGVCEGGMEWTLSDAQIASSDLYGVSNQALDDPWVSVSQGALLVVMG